MAAIFTPSSGSVNSMKQIVISFLKWSILFVGVALTSSLLHPDLFRTTGPIFALFMFVKLLSRYVEKPFSGLVFSLVVIFISGISATSLLKHLICEWYPGIAVCSPNFLRAQSFDFVVFPALIIVPWGAMAIRKFSRTWTR